MSRFIFSLVLLIFVWVASAQTVGTQKPEEKLLDSLWKARPKFLPHALVLNYNVFRLAETTLDKPINSQEFQIELGVNKFFVVADYGRAISDRGEDYSYSSDGSYWRVGVDVNMSKNWREQMIGIGLRYCKANFSDQATFTRTLENDVVQTFDLSNDALTSRWAEFVFKTRVKVWKGLTTGYTLRYQFFEYTPGLKESQLKPFDIPGYGKTNRPNSFQFDYYLGWRIDFK